LKSDTIISELVVLDLEAEDSEDFFRKMSDKLVEKGYVKESFYEAICKREAEFPTALPIEPESVAIPHTDPKHINQAFIAPVRLKKSIKFCEMGANDIVHDVRFVFMLGIKNPEEQIELLQLLVDNLQDEELMRKLNEANTVDEYMAALVTMKGFEA